MLHSLMTFASQAMAEKDKGRAATERAQVNLNSLKTPAADAKARQKPHAKTAFQVTSIHCMYTLMGPSDGPGLTASVASPGP